MYIEVFLLDNLLMNLLILRLAAALLSARPPLLRQLIAAAVSAAFAAAAAYLLPVLNGPLPRAPLLFIMALSFRTKGLRGGLKAVGAVMGATLVVGGAAFAAALLTGGGTENGFLVGGTPLRAAAAGAAAAALLPSVARRMLRRRLKNESLVRVTVLHRGILRSFTGVVDTGNSLREPIGGMPVIVLRCRALEPSARLPIPTVTAACRGVLMGFHPEHVSVDGREVDCVVAITKQKLTAEAIVPPELC